MSKVRSTLLFVILLSAVALTAQDVRAQWNINAAMPFNITCVRFLQAENAREPAPLAYPLFHHGVVGGSFPSGTRGISYILSGATAWTPAFMPAFWTDGWISDFSFEDTLTGYASIYGAASSFYGLPGVSGVMKTTDGGANWNFLANAPPEVRGLYYDWANGRLYCSSGGTDNTSPGGAYVSTDHGGTWKRINITKPLNTGIDSACYYTGFASWNGTDIVLATLGAPNPCSNADPTKPNNIPLWLVSHDGGLSWQTIQLSASSWQPVALRGTRAFFATSYNPNGPYSSMYSSQDNGNSWRTVSGFAQTNSAVTECMGGDPCVIVAGDSTGTGMLYSVDDGGLWQPFGPSSPPTPVDYRMYVGTDSIWAYSGRILQSIARPFSKPIHILPNTVNFAQSGCFTSDTVIQLFGCNCGNDTLIGDRLQWNTTGGLVGDTAKFKISATSDTNFHWPSPPIPHLLCGLDSVHIQYTPNGANPDVDTAHLIFHDGTNIIDTPIVILGNGSPAGYTTNWKSNQTVNLWGQGGATAKACEQVDTELCFYNTTCSDLYIQKIEISGTPGDMGVIQETSPPVISDILLPRRGGQQCIHFKATATNAGDYYITVRVTFDQGPPPVAFYLHLGVVGKVLPFVRSFNLVDSFDCVRHGINDTAIYYFDTTCKDVLIRNIRLLKGLDFVLDPATVLKAQHDSITLYRPDTSCPGCSSVLKVPVHLVNSKPGVYRDTIEFIDSMTDGTFVHTLVPISYQILSTISIKPIGSTTFNFHGVSSCDSAEICVPLKIQNKCDFGVRVTGYSGDTSGGYHVVHHPSVGDTISPGQSDTICVEWPFAASKTPKPGWLSITYRHGDDSSVVLYQISGTAVTGTNARITPDSNIFGPMKAGCDVIDVWDTLHNLTCGAAITVDHSTVLSGRAILISPANGVVIPVGGDTVVHLQFVAQAGDAGQYCGSIQFLLLGVGVGGSAMDTVNWCTTVIPAQISALAIPGSIMKTDSLPCNTPLDTTITIHNTAPCGRSFAVTGASTGLQGVIVSTLPKTLAPGESETIILHFPGNQTGNGGSYNGSVSVTGDTSFTVPYDIPYKPCSSGTVVLFDTTAKTNLSTPRCVMLYDTMDIAVTSGTATINSIALNPTGGGYTLTVVPPGAVPSTLNAPQKLLFVVGFNPDLAPTGGATSVEVSYSVGGTTTPATIPINTSVSGTHYSVQLSMTSPDPKPKLIAPDGSSTKHFVVTALGDAVPPSAGVTSFKITLQYNTNLLTLSGLPALGPGWTPSVPLPTDGSNGSYVFSVVPPVGGITPGGIVATITMTAAIPMTDTTTMIVGPSLFNPSDTNFTRCTATAASDGSNVPVQLQLNCSDSIIMIANQGNLSTVTNIEVIPNPAHKSNGSSAMLKFTSLLGADATVDLLDLSGQTVARLSQGALAKGDHTLAIPTASLAEGTYFARIQIAGFTVVRKFVIEKE